MATPPLYARPPATPAEDRRLRKLARSRHAPASWIQRARIITASWDGATVTEVAQAVGCHPKTVYKWLHRFNAAGLDGLADLPRPGAPRRLTEHERGRIIQLAGSEPPGRLQQESGWDGMVAYFGLYYPFIHFRNEAWLKLAALYGALLGRHESHRPHGRTPARQ